MVPHHSLVGQVIEYSPMLVKWFLNMFNFYNSSVEFNIDFEVFVTDKGTVIY